MTDRNSTVTEKPPKAVAKKEVTKKSSPYAYKYQLNNKDTIQSVLVRLEHVQINSDIERLLISKTHFLLNVVLNLNPSFRSYQVNKIVTTLVVNFLTMAEDIATNKQIYPLNTILNSLRVY